MKKHLAYRSRILAASVHRHGRPAPASALAAGAPDVAARAQAPQAAHRRRGAAQDLNLVNGRIHTMDARNTVVSAVAIRNGRFASVGNTAPPRTPNTRVIDLRGRTVVPGLIEPTSTSSAWPTGPAITRSSRTRRRSARSRKRWPRAARACPRASGSRRWAAGIRTSGPSIAIRR